MGSHAVILLDTHALVWFATGDERLGLSARARIEACNIDQPFFVSAISAWELAMLVGKGRLDLGKSARDWFEQASEIPAWRTLPLDAETAIEAVNLPGNFHGDPADRFLVAAARVHDLTLVTADWSILNYAKSGHVSVLDANK
jgi:PIN domain nuclease of toxin-antitoxin system